MVHKLSLRDLPIQGKRVLMRVDFNVPMDNSGHITDDTRLTSTLPSIRYVLDHGGSLVLMSHMGRPKGKRSKELSLAPCAKRLSQLLERPVTFVTDCVGPEVEQKAKALKPGEVLLLENLRFYPAEEEPQRDPNFAQQLAKLGDFYVNEAFGSAHRAHSSTATIAKYFPGRAAGGFHLMKEVEFLGEHLDNPERPFYAIIGGNKASSKLGVLKSLLHKADALFFGGAMAFTFLKAQGFSIGHSLCEDDQVIKAKELLATAQKQGVKIWLPVDAVVVPEIDEAIPADRVIVLKDGIPNNLMGVDIGPQTVELFNRELKKAKTILWNGPMGVFEIPQFATGTKAVAECLASLPAMTIVGGGDSVAAVRSLGVGDKLTHLSTGGGATLEYIEFGSLPGVEALSNAKTEARR
ncbi:MAG: phosphoglycerate kinase [Chlamydiales bacterium]|nr:phosphoglycerate kinase [Chlamydiales bacterium]